MILVVHLAALIQWVSPGPRRLLLCMFASIYFSRLTFMAGYVLQRELAMEELTFVSLIWIPTILVSFTYGAASSAGSPVTSRLVLATFAYFAGSFLNTFSELQRKWWKSQPQNKGRCYTRGLFSLSRNVNYLGDIVLFAAWADATDVWWNLWVPLVMTNTFVFHHIPDKEKYLAKRYEQDWPIYQASTKALIPWIF